MTDYLLTIDFESRENLDSVLKKNLVIVLAKIIPQEIPIAWVAMPPNKVKIFSAWSNHYAAYASTVPPDDPKNLFLVAAKAMDPDQKTSFEDGHFSEPKNDPDLKGQGYRIANNYSESTWLTFGLAQDITFDGLVLDEMPINATKVHYHHDLTVCPEEKLAVFLADDVRAHQPLTSLPDGAPCLTFDSDHPAQTVTYCKKTGQFQKKDGASGGATPSSDPSDDGEDPEDDPETQDATAHSDDEGDKGHDEPHAPD